MIPGKKEHTISIAKIIIIKGRDAFATLIISILLREETTYKFKPTGGVRTPMERFTVMMIPKTRGST